MVKGDFCLMPVSSMMERETLLTQPVEQAVSTDWVDDIFTPTVSEYCLPHLN